MFSKCKNTKQQGNIGLGYAIQYFTKELYTVSLPLNDSQDYDLIIEDKDGTLKKVQVKTTHSKMKSGTYNVNLRVLGGNSKKNYVHKKGNEIIYDLLFVLCDNGDTYLIPKEVISNKLSNICVGKLYKEYKL